MEAVQGVMTCVRFKMFVIGLSRKGLSENSVFQGA